MDADVSRPEDHLGLLIHVKLCSSISGSQFGDHVLFNRLVERLKRIGSVCVSDNPQRYVVPNFCVNVSESKFSWGEFQQHRKVFGLICVAFDSIAPSEVNGFQNEHKVEENLNSEKNGRRSSVSGFLEQYFYLKEQYRSSLVDARCIFVGTTVVKTQRRNSVDTDAREDTNGQTFATDGILRYTSLDEAQELEHDVRDYVKAIYWVLESKRLDVSFEKVDNPTCPLVPDEEKYFVGLDKNSRAFRKRCVGRLRKQVADIALMTGLPTLALDSYNAAIDQLKSANDFLWLAGAYEGYACAALIAKFGAPALNSFKNELLPSTLQRAPSFTPGQMKKAQQDRNPSPARNDVLIRRATSAVSGDSPRYNASTRVLVSDTDIEEKFRLAIENYQKFSFAAHIECECAFKATALYLFERRYDALDEFLNIYCGRFLDEKFEPFTDIQKALICNSIASIYKNIGFRRKMAFFTRLSALFRLYLNRDDPISLNDYKQIYPLLLASLDGYHISRVSLVGKNSSPGAPTCGWPAVQIRALHETYVSAQRANYREAAVRHLAQMIQLIVEHGGSVELLTQLCNEFSLMNEQSGVHNVSTHLRINNGAILPPVQLSTLPKFISIELKPLPAHLSPSDVPDDCYKPIFIYSPFQCGLQNNAQTRWVCECESTVVALLQNLLPCDLEVKNITLLGEGASFESIPVTVTLSTKQSNLTVANLPVIPKEHGRLTITGYSCEVMGAKSVCRLDDIPWLKRGKNSALDVEVLPPLPLLEIASPLPRAENQTPSEASETCSVEITLYAGQKTTQKIELKNVSDIAIDRVIWEIQQPNVFGNVNLLAVDDNVADFCAIFEPNTVRNITARITAIDPLTIEGESDDNQMKKLAAAGDKNAPKLIPYTGRVLVTTIKFIYSAGEYQRACALSIFVTILPVVVVVDWHVLPGESCNDRYIALDVVNSTEYEVDVHFPVSKTVSIQSKDTCRVPVLCECCDFSSVASEHVCRGPYAKTYLSNARRKFVQAHLMARLKIKWNMAHDQDVCGEVPIGAVLSSEKLCNELVLPLVSLDVVMEGAECSVKGEYVAGVGEKLILRATWSTAKPSRRLMANLRLLFCQDFQNGMIELTEDILIIGSVAHRFFLDDSKSNSHVFQFIFCNEGTYQAKIVCDIEKRKPVDADEIADTTTNASDEYEDMLFGSPVVPVFSFNVISRIPAEVP